MLSTDFTNHVYLTFMFILLTFLHFKKYRNLVNRKLKEAQNQFSEDFLRKLKPRKRKGNSLRKILEKNNSPKITEID